MNFYNESEDTMKQKNQIKINFFLALLLTLPLTSVFFGSAENVEARANFWNMDLEASNACKYLVRNLGYTKYAAAGILGNFQHESNLNPYVRERIGNHNTYSLGKAKADMLDPDNNGFGPGWGLAQWGDGSGRNGAGSKRWISLVNYVNQKYKTSYSAQYADSYRWNVDNENSLRANIPNLYQQLEFVKEEMKEGSYYVSQSELNKMSTIEETSNAVLYRYEIAGTRGSITSAKRIGYAKEIYRKNCAMIAGEDYVSVAKPPYVAEGHVENIGWQNQKYNNSVIGTLRQSLRLEAIKLNKFGTETIGDIEYQAHVENIGWQNIVRNGAVAGTSGKSLRIEALRIQMTGNLEQQYDIYYRAHVQDMGWLGWTKNGASAGSQGFSRRLEAIEILAVAKGSTGPAQWVSFFEK